MLIAGQTDIGQSRDENQDNYRSANLGDFGAYGVVCDGMGGASNGRLASALAVDSIAEQLNHGLPKVQNAAEIERLMLDAIYLANTEIFSRSGGGEMMMGTTVVLAIVHGNVLHLAHVGDSRAYLFEDGRLTQLTRDHSVVQELIDKGNITEEEAKVHPEKNVITRALGVEIEVDVSYSRRILNAGAVLLVCTDGLTNMVEPEGIARTLNESDFFSLPGRLVQDALQAGGSDNITVLVMQRRETDDA